mgnify:CR=1 FL=1
MSEILDRIVNCDISIEKPVMDSASFGTVLIIGDAPTNGGKDLRTMDKYASLAEVTDAGWAEGSEIYKAARAAFLQKNKPELVYIAVRQEKTAEGGGREDILEGDAEAQPEEIGAETGARLEKFSDTVRRVLGMPGWYGLVLAGAAAKDYDEVAYIIEGAEKLFVFSVQTKELPLPLSRTDYLRTAVIYAESADEYADVAWLTECFSYAPGSETWAYKMLSGVRASELTTREMGRFDEANVNYYIRCANKDITLQGKVIGGEWIDVIRFRDWLKNEMQIKIFSLFVTYPKIPYLDSGITLVENQMRATLQNGQEAGGVAMTEFDENEESVEGFTVTVPKAASLSSADRASRKLRNCMYTARLAGAIHIVEIQGNLVF